MTIRIEPQTRTRTAYEINESESLKREKDVVEIVSVQRLPRRKEQGTQRTVETLETSTVNYYDRDIFINNKRPTNRGQSNEAEKIGCIEEVVIDDGIRNQRRMKVDIKEDRHTTRQEVVIAGDQAVPPTVLTKDPLIITETRRDHTVIKRSSIALCR